MQYHFFLWLPLGFSITSFEQFSYDMPCVIFFMFLMLGFHWITWIYGFKTYQIWKHFGYYFSKCFFPFFLFLILPTFLCFGNFSYLHMRPREVLHSVIISLFQINLLFSVSFSLDSFYYCALKFTNIFFYVILSFISF